MYIDDVRPLLMVSNSEIASFKQCRRKWNLSSFNRRNLIPRVPNLKLWIGTGGHYALERWHGYGEDPIVVFRQWAQQQVTQIAAEAGVLATGEFFAELDTLVDTGVKILEHYVEYATKHLIPKYRYIATEYEFSVPIPNMQLWLVDWENEVPYSWVVQEWGTNFWEHDQFKKLYVDRGLYDAEHQTIPPLYVGRLDGLVEDQSGGVWVIDHKFMAALVNPEMLLIDEQTAKYVWAAKVCIENGWWPEVPQGTMVRGALYNVIRKKAPSIPALNKNGKTSEAKNIDTTEAVYKKTLLERGQDPSEYLDMLLFLRSKPNKFFQLERIERGDRELELIGEKLTFEYQYMNDIAMVTKDPAHPILFPTPSPDCSWKCSFKNVCYLLNSGDDAEFLIKNSMIHQKRTDLYSSQLEDTPDM